MANTMNTKTPLMHLSKYLLPLTLLLCAAVYWPGLHGPFLFDDYAHIVQNKRVHISDLSPTSLVQAWKSSLASGFGKRPLAQLSFGINHALAGLSPFAFKATNLGIHLLNGVLLFLLIRQLASLATRPGRPGAPSSDTLALMVTAIWLLHPLNLTAVLYVVQRMTSLSATFVLAGLWLYVSGRLNLAQNGRGWVRILASFPLAGIGFLAKENAALYPLFVAVLEFTLLRQAPVDEAIQRRRHWLLLGLLVAAPLLLGALYALTHPGLYDASGRPFTLEQRLLTEPRILWIYLRQFIAPDITTMGLFHDDLVVSTGLFQPPTTGLSILAWVLAAGSALLLAKRHPVYAFSILFFLAGHALESSFIPLELVFEHRNYLPLIGPAFGLAHGLLNARIRTDLQRALRAVAIAFPFVLATLTFLRATDWRSLEDFSFAEVEHHPGSPRANLKAAQIMLDSLDKVPAEKRPLLAKATRERLEQLLSIDPEQPNGLFALMYLEYKTEERVRPKLISRLRRSLRTGNLSPLRFSAIQFLYFVILAEHGQSVLPPDTMQDLMAQAINNPSLDVTGKAGVQSDWRYYCDKVLNQPKQALKHAAEALRLWPQRWHYRKVKADLEIRLGMTTAAIETVRGAFDYDIPPLQRAEAERMLAHLLKHSDKTDP
jgi:tetratricopeptide (TPR) repeat protein